MIWVIGVAPPWVGATTDRQPGIGPFFAHQSRPLNYLCAAVFLTGNHSFCAESPDTDFAIRFTMFVAILARFSLTTWFFDAWGEMVRYFNGMDTTHYGVLAGCAVAFGFLCLKGSGINR